MNFLKFVRNIFILLITLSSGAQSAKPASHSEETKTRLDGLIGFYSQNQSMDIIFKIDKYEDLFLTDTSCSQNIDSRIELMMLYLELDFYDLMASQARILENCKDQISSENTAINDLLLSYATQMTDAALPKEDISIDILEKLVKASCKHMATIYETKKTTLLKDEM